MKKLGIIGSFSVYIPASLLMFCLTKFLIPYLSEISGEETILFWFIVAGLGVFTPLIITGIVILKSEDYKLSAVTFVKRLRFKPLTKSDFLWCLAGLTAIGVFSYLAMEFIELIYGKFEHSPSFMAFEPLSPGRYWLLLVWLPYWFLNIFGEEFLWRGVMFPRQEIAFGKYTWLVHGLGWGLFHIAFGWQMLITLLPIIFILPFIIQKTKNSWVGIILHGALNGPSFIAICFGLI